MHIAMILTHVLSILIANGTEEDAKSPLVVATGLIVSANANVIVYRPLTSSGQLGKAQTLKLRGTSRVFLYSKQKRGEVDTAVQTETKPARLERNQYIAAICLFVDDKAVLLSAVVQPRK